MFLMKLVSSSPSRKDERAHNLMKKARVEEVKESYPWLSSLWVENDLNETLDNWREYVKVWTKDDPYISFEDFKERNKEEEELDYLLFRLAEKKRTILAIQKKEREPLRVTYGRFENKEKVTGPFPIALYVHENGIRKIWFYHPIGDSLYVHHKSLKTAPEYGRYRRVGDEFEFLPTNEEKPWMEKWYKSAKRVLFVRKRGLKGPIQYDEIEEFYWKEQAKEIIE